MTKQAEILKEEKRRKSVPEKGEEIDEEDKISLIMVGEVADEEVADAKKMEEEEKDENVEDEEMEDEEWMEEVVEVKKLRLTVEETETTRNRLESELMMKVTIDLIPLPPGFVNGDSVSYSVNVIWHRSQHFR